MTREQRDSMAPRVREEFRYQSTHKLDSEGAIIVIDIETGERAFCSCHELPTHDMDGCAFSGQCWVCEAIDHDDLCAMIDWQNENAEYDTWCDEAQVRLEREGWRGNWSQSIASMNPRARFDSGESARDFARSIISEAALKVFELVRDENEEVGDEYLLPPGFRVGDCGDIYCRHRDVSCCDECAAEHEQIIEVYGQHFWEPNAEEREQLRRDMQDHALQRMGWGEK